MLSEWLKHKKCAVSMDYLVNIAFQVVFLGVVIHAPLGVIGTKLLPQYSNLIKSWKEGVIFLIFLGLVYLYAKKRLFFNGLSNVDKSVIGLVVAYGLLHIVVALATPGQVEAEAAGLLIDMRFVAFFVLAYLFYRNYPQYIANTIRVVFAGLMLVTAFATLQIFLPRDILAHIGYDKYTIIPYLLVDENQSLVRVNSTLRGPNPLGAYSVIAISLVISALAAKRTSLLRGGRPMLLLLAASSIISLIVSYSRAALIAAVVAMICLGIFGIYKISMKMTRNWTLFIGAILLVGSLITTSTSLMHSIILHDNPANGYGSNSNNAHIQSILAGINAVIEKPLGYGVGSMGSASLRSSQPALIENQYLFIAHETGVAGLMLFMGIFAGVLMRLWGSKGYWLAGAVLASGVGLTVIGLLLPVWADDTVSITWWGLAGVASGAIANGFYPKVKSTSASIVEKV